MLFFFGHRAQAGAPINGFLVDASVINYMLNNGAGSVKIYMAQGADGTINYIVVPSDGSFRTMGGQVYKQVGSGVCPPSCEFPPSSLAGHGSFTDAGDGSTEINNFMQSHNGVVNCVRLCKSTLDKVRSDYPFIKVVYDSSVTVSGINEDGTTGRRSTYSESCNTTATSGM
ncbi:hypothetical protein CAP35_10930 [Chitinophagaceae bacterium IBVUCB1]|nr:hypothetical protein CAP35_10930 [Chitinophagaceae bacterium IBVUCB1]